MDQPTSHVDDQLAALRRLADELCEVPVGAPVDGVKAKEFVLRFKGLDFTCSDGDLPSAWQPADEHPGVTALNLDGTEVTFPASDTDCIAEERVDLTNEEREVFDALTDTPQTAEVIARSLGMSVFTVRSILAIGQQAGIATDDSDWRAGAPPAYRRRPQSPYWTEARA